MLSQAIRKQKFSRRYKSFTEKQSKLGDSNRPAPVKILREISTTEEIVAGAPKTQPEKLLYLIVNKTYSARVADAELRQRGRRAPGCRGRREGGENCHYGTS